MQQANGNGIGNANVNADTAYTTCWPRNQKSKPGCLAAKWQIVVRVPFQL